jgi:hypothetical protein
MTGVCGLRTVGIVVTAVCVLGAGVGAAAGPQRGFLTVRDGGFAMGGQRFSVRASDADPAVGHWFKFQGPWFATGLQKCVDYDFNAMRTWVPGTGGDESGAAYNAWKKDRDAFYSEFSRVFIDQCRAKGVYLILTFTQLPESAAPGSKFDVDSPAYRAWKEFVQDFSMHYMNETQVLFYEVANEYRGSPRDLPGTRRFYEQAAADIRAVDPNHLISSGVDGGMHWPDTPEAREFWVNINASRGIDITSIHAYVNDPWTYNWHTERDYQRMVRGMVGAARELGKPLFLGEFGAEPRLSANGENPEIIWYMKAVIREGIPAYGFHWFYPVPEPGLFRVIPELSPRTAQWMKELNEYAAAGKEVPADFGPKTTDYAFPICTGATALAGPAPVTRGAAEAKADPALYGQAAPSLRVTWQKGGASVELGPYHPNDLSEYREAGGRFTFALHGEARPAEAFRVAMLDATGKSSAADTTRATELEGGWVRVEVPLEGFAIDWTQWQGVRLEFGPDTSGSINVDDFQVVCGG